MLPNQQQQQQKTQINKKKEKKIWHSWDAVHTFRYEWNDKLMLKVPTKCERPPRRMKTPRSPWLVRCLCSLSTYSMIYLYIYIWCIYFFPLHNNTSGNSFYNNIFSLFASICVCVPLFNTTMNSFETNCFHYGSSPSSSSPMTVIIVIWPAVCVLCCT